MFGNNSEYFTPSTNPVNIIGVGATGSHLAYQLAKLGVPIFNLYDFDVVEEKNIANQLYLHEDVGKLKIEATKERIKEINPTATVNTTAEKISDTFDSEGPVFLLVDTMASRKTIFNTILKNNEVITRNPILIDTRLAATYGHIYTVLLNNDKLTSDYNKTLHSDSNVQEETSPCGQVQSIVATINAVVSLATWAYISYSLDPKNYSFSTSIALQTRQLITE